MVDQNSITAIPHNQEFSIQDFSKSGFNPNILDYEPRADKSHGYIYAIAADGRTKIGMTQNPPKRITAICTQAGFVAVEVFVSNPCSNYRELESAAHRNFSADRMTGEWFAISMADAVGFATSCEYRADKVAIAADDTSIIQAVESLHYDGLYVLCRPWVSEAKLCDAAMARRILHLKNNDVPSIEIAADPVSNIISDMQYFNMGRLDAIAGTKARAVGYGCKDDLLAAISERYASEKECFTDAQIHSLLKGVWTDVCERNSAMASASDGMDGLVVEV